MSPSGAGIRSGCAAGWDATGGEWTGGVGCSGAAFCGSGGRALQVPLGAFWNGTGTPSAPTTSASIVVISDGA